MKQNRLLIVDDDVDIREMLENYFHKENYEVALAQNGIEGLQIARKEDVDVILLDVMMPEMDGYTMLEELRKTSDVPVILLTAKGEQISKIKGFTKGCDDYVVKPFDLAELSCRIGAMLRRGSKTTERSDDIQVKDLKIRKDEHSVFKGSEQIELTPKEYDILLLMASNKGRIYSTKMLYELIWQDAFMENDNSVITHIRNLRDKIGDDAKQGDYIKTVWGVGYKIEKDN